MNRNEEVNQSFLLNRNVIIKSTVNGKEVERGIERMYRDIRMTLKETDKRGNRILLVYEKLPEEVFCISFTNQEEMVIKASDGLGFIYALFYVSKVYLGIQPFWFWNDQTWLMQEEIRIPMETFQSSSAKVRFRGWFINDEVLIDKWKAEGSSVLPWEMAMEALLRCGGNMVIPGTDKNAKKYRNLASDMGLWITHHHAEPLGAEMFSRAFPNLTPSYKEHPDLFCRLWEKGIAEQKDRKVIWNLGFRGQGDRSFWMDDPQYETQKSRGELISSVIKTQYNLLCSKVKNPVCCTNLYGETMELYKEGFLDIPKEIIKIWADNGYGKMVSRRQGNNNSRVYALPQSQENQSGQHGLYYHVSFYDLQAANHLTMQPNSLDFISRELEYAFSQGADDYLLVNCSNIKPHVYFLDAIKNIWLKGSINPCEQGKAYIHNYYFLNCKSEQNENLVNYLYRCYSDYAECTVPFGNFEDEHAGEQFYNYTTRILSSQWLKGNFREGAKALFWAAGEIGFTEQIQWFFTKCKAGKIKFEQLYSRCSEVYELLEEKQKTLFEDSLLLQVRIHLKCLEGAIAFCESFDSFNKNFYQKSFYLLGYASDKFREADEAMRKTEHDKWVGFYKNDCLCDIKQTAYFLKHIMGYVRNIGEGPHFYSWQREFLYAEEDRKIVLLTNQENHLTDEEFYECMKSKRHNLDW